ncbi:unnamed protein product [Orchesella dallaii]|uniref:Uncharacterized protein n=1 Tax=Orchesella dallaii TaxID=48710 RepID=A0ABP1R3M6_9HEXA
MAFNPCCCISAKTGATILGVLDIIVSVLGIFNVLSNAGSISKAQSDPNLKVHLTQQIRNAYKGYPGYETLDDEEILRTLYASLIRMLVVYIVNLFLSSILIHGILKENTKLLKVHLIICGALFCMSLVVEIFYTHGP